MAATATKTPEPTQTDIDEGFNTTEVTHKGKTYTFRELSAEEYDGAVALATLEELDNNGDKKIDSVQLLRWMIVRASLDPKLDPAAIGKLPFSANTKISKAVNDLHFAPDEDLAMKACINEKCEWSDLAASKLTADAKFCSKCGTEQPETPEDQKPPNS